MAIGVTTRVAIPRAGRLNTDRVSDQPADEIEMVREQGGQHRGRLRSDVDGRKPVNHLQGGDGRFPDTPFRDEVSRMLIGEPESSIEVNRERSLPPVRGRDHRPAPARLVASGFSQKT